MTAFVWTITICAGLYVAAAVVFALLMATGLAPEGGRLRTWARRIVGSASYAAGVLIVGVLLLKRPKRTLRRGLVKQVREGAKARARVREVIADGAAAIRRTGAATEGRVVDLRFEADNRVAEIRAEVAAMDDDALLDAAREVGR